MSGIMEGPLSKWTNVMQGWQYRWFVLDENICLLSYYTVSSFDLCLIIICCILGITGLPLLLEIKFVYFLSARLLIF